MFHTWSIWLEWSSYWCRHVLRTELPLLNSPVTRRLRWRAGVWMPWSMCWSRGSKISFTTSPRTHGLGIPGGTHMGWAYLGEPTWAGHTFLWNRKKRENTSENKAFKNIKKKYNYTIQHSIVFLVEGREGTVLQEMDEQAREEFFRVKKALASEDFVSDWCHPLFWILQKHELCGEDLTSSCFFGCQ